MKRALILAVLVLTVSAKGQNVLTGKEIYRINRDAVVQIYVGDNFRGAGFIVSADGIIATANHVITTRESLFKQYAADIKVLVNGKGRPYPATPVAGEVSADQTNYDSALLKITASNLPHVILGDWSEVDVGDPLIIIPSLPNIGHLMLEGTVSSKGRGVTDFGPKPVNMLLFQSPVRNGFSGAPIFSSGGHVIGIQDTKVFGITPALDSLRTKWMSGPAPGVKVYVKVGGVDIAANFIELIDNLDQNLISGLGSGVDIRYAKQLQQNAAKQNR